MPQYKRVRIVMVSNTGARKSHIIVCGRIGIFLTSFRLRYVLADQTGQEHAFNSLRNRTPVVRATSLTEKEATGKLMYFQDKEKPPTIKTDSADLAAWIVEYVCGGTKPLCGESKLVCSGIEPVRSGIELACGGSKPVGSRAACRYNESIAKSQHLRHPMSFLKI
jgi:hypothetical protein